MTCKNCYQRIELLDCGTYVHQSTGSFLCSQVESEILDGTTVAEPFAVGTIIGFKHQRLVRLGKLETERLAGEIIHLSNTGSIIVKCLGNLNVCFTPAPWFDIDVLVEVAR